jgi:hypothetical protein
MSDYWIYNSERYWVVEYQYYGDPKFGKPGGMWLTVDAEDPVQLAIPDAILDISVPSYEVITDDEGYDHVTIPGGSLIVEDGLPQVPFWTETLVYPAGTRINNVSLTARSGYTFDTGLNLPVNEMAINSLSQASQNQAQPYSFEEGDWIPELDRIYKWEVIENPDGSSELVIQIYPFHYQPATTNFDWYNQFTFDIDMVSTSVKIDILDLDKNTYIPGELVLADLWLNNPGDADNLVIIPRVRSLVSDTALVGTIELATLHAADGLAHYSLEWDSSEFEPGLFIFEVEVRDGQSSLLHKAERVFEIVGAIAEISDLTAEPEIFRPGESITITATLQNSGYTPLSGLVNIKVQSAAEETLMETFSHTVTDLAPGGTLIFYDNWDSSGAADGEYQIIAYMVYGSKTSNVKSAVITTFKQLYLPLITK